ncbi:MAG: helix-hairpin-helix domain-containing protein [Negativicutes bacterium]|nr:helix-hairpin-helix domain-containing protein [Negativicutes bacterium]
MNKLSLRQGMFLGLLGGLIISAAGLRWWNAAAIQPAVIQNLAENDVGAQKERNELTPADRQSVQKEEAGEIVVHLAGAVRQPGLLRLTGGSRLGEAILLAGGETEAADLDQINLAAILQDGQRYYIPSVGETAAEDADARQTTSDGKVNLNLADAETLATLPQIGEVRAQAIIAYREKNGNFQKIEDIMQVAGIGNGIYAAIAAFITVQ